MHLTSLTVSPSAKIGELTDDNLLWLALLPIANEVHMQRAC